MRPFATVMAWSVYPSVDHNCESYIKHILQIGKRRYISYNQILFTLTFVSLSESVGNNK